jgi:ABC-type glycerol-3-phosphate transport system permease component
MAFDSTLSTIERPKLSFIHIAFLFHVGSFILALWGFWTLETILWNRIVYSNGEWANSFPIYLRTSLESLKEMLLADVVLFSVGALAIVLISILIFYKYLRNSEWDSNKRLLFIIQTLITFFVSLMGFWINQSLSAISAFPAEEGGLSGNEWLYQEIPEFADFLGLLSIIIQIIFSILFVFSLVILVLNREREETLEERNALRRFLQNPYRYALNFVRSLPFYLVISCYLLLTLLPVFMTLFVALSTSADLRAHRLPTSPLEGFIKNFSSVIFAISVSEPAFASAFINSIILGFGTGIFGLAVSLSAGYALARFKFAGNKVLTFMILSTQMFPGLILLIPQFVIWKDLGLLEDHLLIFGVLLAYISGAVAYTTWMMKGYFETIPIDLEEAALIDGAGRLGTFFRIAIPLAKPGMVAVLIFTYLTAWSEFVLARTFIGETDPQATLPLLFYNYQNPAAPDNPIFFELLAPYAIIVALPPVLLFLFLQQELAAGAVAGGVK